MKLPAPDTVDTAQLVARLRELANAMVFADGDRDHMNQSRLSCLQSQMAFQLMFMAADKLEIDEIERDLSHSKGM